MTGPEDAICTCGKRPRTAGPQAASAYPLGVEFRSMGDAGKGKFL